MPGERIELGELHVERTVSVENLTNALAFDHEATMTHGPIADR